MQSQYKFLVTIVDYSLHEKLSKVLRQCKAVHRTGTHGHGFADSEILEMLGFAENRKAVSMLTVDKDMVGTIYAALEKELGISKKGAGIAFTVPMSAASGFCGKLMQLAKVRFMQEEKTGMAQNFTYSHELIITIVTKGSAELVKEAAKKSGARGGTMVHGLGLGGEEAAKFLGISIQEEKDIVLIVVDKKDRPEIMRAIVQECGIESEAQGICFSLPVDSAAGLR